MNELPGWGWWCCVVRIDEHCVIPIVPDSQIRSVEPGTQHGDVPQEPVMGILIVDVEIGLADRVDKDVVLHCAIVAFAATDTVAQAKVAINIVVR